MPPTDRIKAPAGPDEISRLVSAFESATNEATACALAQLLGALERLKAVA